MKKLILSLSITISLLCSCTNNDDLVTKNSDARISNVLKEKNYDSQKLMYRMLSNDEKRMIWIEKIDNLISIKKFNSKQIDLLIDLKSNLTVDLFDESSNNDKKAVFKTVYVKQFLKKSEKVFSPEEFNDYFYSITSKAITPPSCSCNIGSIYSCAGVSSDCVKTTFCTVSTVGCGFLTMFECTGRCYIY